MQRNAFRFTDIGASSCPAANSGPARLLRAATGHEDLSGDVVVVDCADLATERAIWAGGLTRCAVGANGCCCPRTSNVVITVRTATGDGSVGSGDDQGQKLAVAAVYVVAVFINIIDATVVNVAPPGEGEGARFGTVAYGVTGSRSLPIAALLGDWASASQRRKAVAPGRRATVASSSTPPTTATVHRAGRCPG